MGSKPMTNAVYSVPTLAERWGCGTDTIYTLIRSGDLTSFKLGGKLIRIRADEVERYECRSTASNDTEASSPSSGLKMVSDTATRLERLTAPAQKPQPESSGNDAR